ncbi:sensor histidine kinase [Undibacterium pigrum]|uniref:histidine kinase n=1 Tax=Undibacterium pigrum TaxID=401470 RepID=A0A318J828_9BURK|nr:ATP-binding protein [Undibacterium pigrum]PXX43303.1 histidine kinase/DNA gyrase B/HSP90-like ATPase [Undibacterium pigrum]
MTSDPSPAWRGKLLTVCGMLIIVGAATAMTYLHTAGQSDQLLRWSIVMALLAVSGLLMFIRGLSSLAAPQARPDAGNLLPAMQRDGLQQTALTLESRLEHAPIALFCVESKGQEKNVSPLNGNARRLIAPGRVIEVSQLYEQIIAQAVGKRSMICFETEQGQERALLASSSLTLQSQAQLIVALMPVESELQMEAQQAWQKLIRVLTHEIMNSLTPVASLSSTAQDMLNDLQLPQQNAADLALALDAISRRAHGLVNFVGSYRSLANVPVAQLERVQLQALLARISSLVSPMWQSRGGEIQFSVEPANLEAMLDPAQLEQALINLIKNAFEATASVQPAIVSIRAQLSRGARLRIEVSDNGPGVPKDLIAHIFTPFFSTREHGSGIGLALVRQLVQGNGGTVRYADSVGGGARFIISL